MSNGVPPNKDDPKARTAANVELLLRVCSRRGRVLVLMQDNPDPDALASAVALRELIHVRLKKWAVIGYGGACGRAENRAMIAALHIGAKPVTVAQLQRFSTICLVDTQPYAGNNILTEPRTAEVVIDHHRLPKKRSWKSEVVDVRPDYGANSSILYEYLQVAEVKLNSTLATALFYGVQSDTQDLGREAGPADVRAYSALFLLADKKKLARIRRAQVPQEYFSMLSGALANGVIVGTTVVSRVPFCRNADMISEVADLLLRLEGVRSVVCYGVYEDRIFLSARALDARSNMADRMKHVVRRLGTGGGHRTMAGGQISVDDDAEKRLAMVQERIFRFFAPKKQPVPLAPVAVEKKLPPDTPDSSSAPPASETLPGSA